MVTHDYSHGLRLTNFTSQDNKATLCPWHRTTCHPCYPTFFYRRPDFRRCGRLCLEQASSRHQIRHFAICF